MKISKANERADLMAANIESKRGKIDLPLPTPEIVREAIHGTLNSRNGKMLSNAPKQSAKPLAHVLHKLILWHRSGGNLWGVAMLPMNCANIAEKRELNCTGRELFDQLDTLAILLRGGQSTAANNWARVLGN